MRIGKRWWVLGPLGLLIVALVAVQFVPTGFSHSNPPVVAEPAWDSPATRALAVQACFDCHSNETEWPWYSRVAPMSWLVEADVKKGRAALNFSEWTPEAAVETEEVVEVIAKGQMPLPYYTILHPEARLSAKEKGQLTAGLMATLEGSDAELTTDDLNRPDSDN